MTCFHCHGPLLRVKRRFLGKLVYDSSYRCMDCGARVHFPKNWLNLFSLYVCCPRCGAPDVKKRRKRDGIDRMYRNPISWGQWMLGAPLYHCHDCRLQFYDLRPRERSQRSSSGAS
jgi:DNA-directed RNA polymerase subunit RPC12/RpoP